MTAGFQAFNDSGTFQIDGIFKSYILDRVVTITTTQSVGVDQVTSQGTASINDNEIVAIKAVNPSALITVASGLVYVRTKGVIGSTVTCYFFTPISTSSSNYGLQVFSETTGQLVFCATKKPIRFISFPTGNGSFVYDTNKIYAIIMLTQYYKVQSDRQFLGGTTVRDTIATTRSMVSNLTGGMKVSDEYEFSSVNQYTAPMPPAPVPSSTSIASAYHAIIDVTNY